MKILHTSDWHLGRMLYGHKRYEEFEAFLGWLADTLDRQAIDVLLVAGDVFDNTTPSHRAQALYYRFLCRVSASHCRHVVVIAGNHDSPTFLDAPRELLKALNVYVVGQASEDPADEVVVLSDAQERPELVVCAVPYLRDRDVRVMEAGETLEDKERKLVAGIQAHYARVVAWAECKRKELGVAVPLVGMGHLFTAGGQTVDGDGVRDLYVGSLAHVGATIFPDGLDYLALGHLHVPQRVAGSECMRYSGSPLAMGFGEAAQRKCLCQVTLAAGMAPKVDLLEVPVFQRLESVRGDWSAIARRLLELKAEDVSVWLEVVYEGEAVMADLRERLDEAISGSRLEILRVKNSRVMDRILSRMDDQESLENLDLNEVFERCLAAHDIAEEQRPALLRAYRETMQSLEQANPEAQ